MIRLIILLYCVSPLVAIAQDASDIVTADMAMSAIHTLRADPTSPDIHGAAATIVRYAEQSSDVMVVIGPNYLPWELGAIDNHAEIAMLAAFVAGNLEYQIANKVKEARPLEGILFLAQVYGALRSAGAVERIPKLDEWLQSVNEGLDIDVPEPE